MILGESEPTAANLEAVRLLRDELKWRGASVDLRHPALAPGEWTAGPFFQISAPPDGNGLLVTWPAPGSLSYGGPRAGAELTLGDRLEVSGQPQIEVLGDGGASPGDVLAYADDRRRCRLVLQIRAADGAIREVPESLTLASPKLLHETQATGPNESSEFPAGLILPSLEAMDERLKALVGRHNLDAVGAFDGAPVGASIAYQYDQNAHALLIDIGETLNRDIREGAGLRRDLLERIGMLASQAAAFGYMLAKCEIAQRDRHAVEVGRAMVDLGEGKLQEANEARKAKADVWRVPFLDEANRLRALNSLLGQKTLRDRLIKNAGAFAPGIEIPAPETLLRQIQNWERKNELKRSSHARMRVENQ